MKTKRQPKKPRTEFLELDRAPLIDHLHELRRRLFIVAVSVAGGSALAYAVEKHLINILLHPSHGQKFIYTSPLGGVNFIFSVCIYVGIAISIPVIIYQLLRFLQPMMKDTTARFILWGSFASGIVAVAGILFGYFIGLPAALHFLLHQFKDSTQIEALLTIQSYLSFVTAYMFGSALMFQLPLVLLFINRIKPLKPSKMFKYERHLIVFSVIAGFIMNPSPSLIDQMLVVVPFVLMYQIGILMIWILNRGKYTEKFRVMLDEDASRRAERNDLAGKLTPVLNPGLEAEIERPKPWAELPGESTLLQPVPVIVTPVDTEPQSQPQPGPTPAQAQVKPKRIVTDIAPPPTPGRVRARNQYDVIGGNLIASVAEPPQPSYQQINVRMAE